MNLTETFNTSEEHSFHLYFVSEKEPTEELNFAYEVSFFANSMFSSEIADLFIPFPDFQGVFGVW